MATFYWKSTCSTCRDARKVIHARELGLDEHDTKKTPLTEAIVKSIVAKAGGVLPVMNTRHATAKENGWVAKPPSAAVFAKAVVADVNLLRRPIIVDGDAVLVGFDRDAYAKL